MTLRPDDQLKSAIQGALLEAQLMGPEMDPSLGDDVYAAIEAWADARLRSMLRHPSVSSAIWRAIDGAPSTHQAAQSVVDTISDRLGC